MDPEPLTNKDTALKVVFVLSHPIQYLSPLFARWSELAELLVLYFFRQSEEGQSQAGFSEGFSWDVPLLDGYRAQQLENQAKNPSLRRFLGTNCPDIAGVIGRERPHAVVVLGWNTRAAWQAIRAARRAGSVVLVRTDSQLNSPRSWFKRAAKYLLYRLVLPRTGHFLCAGERSGAYLRHYGVSDEKIHELPHAIDADRFAQTASLDGGQKIRQKLGIKTDGFVFAFVGKMIEKKRPIQAVAAFRQHLKRFPDDHLLMVGSGPLEDDVKAAAADVTNAHYMGFVNQRELPKVYAASNSLMLISDGGETWGVVANEALACGLSLVVCEEAGCFPEFVERQKVGFGCDASVRGIAKALHQARTTVVDPTRIAATVAGFEASAVARKLNETILDVVRIERASEAA